MSTQYYFAPYNSSIAWKKFDVIYDGAYKYATQDQGVGGANGAPTLQISYNVANYRRDDDVATVYFSQTGNVANFQRGSIIKTAGLSNSTLNYTGMVLDGGSGWATYINPGWNEGLTASAGTVRGDNPAWTSGFFFSPTYTTKIGTENQVITAQLGNGYSQRMSNGVNTFQQNLQLVFQNRSDREARAITNFVQDKGGFNPIQIMMPNQFLNNQPNQKWVAPSIDVSPVAYNLNDIAVPIIRVFDP